MGIANIVFKLFDLLGNDSINSEHIENVACVEGERYDLLFTDRQPTLKPIIVNIHGGGFIAGDKSKRRYWCESLAADGWFVINANYRLCPNVTVIDQIKDIWLILQEIPSLSKRYNLDLNKIVVTGDSAGAFLAAYMEALRTNENLRKRFGISQNLDFKFNALLLFCGVYDLPAMIQGNNSVFFKDIADSITGTHYTSQEEMLKYPYYQELILPQYVNSNWCQVALFYAKQDIIAKGQSEILQQALTEHQVPCQEHYTTEIWQNHDYQFFFQTEISKQTMKLVKQFLDKIKNQ